MKKKKNIKMKLMNGKLNTNNEVTYDPKSNENSYPIS